RRGPFMIRPAAESGTQGDYTLDVSLAGDANSDFRVDRRDLRAIRTALGRPADASGVVPGADINGDGRVGFFDLRVAFWNLGASTDIRPLEVALSVDPAADPDGDGRVDADEVDVVGRAAAGATVRLDLGADGSFEAMGTAGADGQYRFTVPLEIGANSIAVA